MERIALLVCALALLGGCATDSNPTGQQGDGWSLRKALADAIAPDGYMPGSGASMSPEVSAQAQAINNAYQADIARQQVGQPALMVSQVTIIGGRINVPSGGGFGSSDWRDYGGVATVTVAECESAPIRLQRSDKAGAVTAASSTWGRSVRRGARFQQMPPAIRMVSFH